MDNFETEFTKKINKYKNKWGEEARLFHIVEETGELFEILMHYKGYKKKNKNKNDIKIALADILDDVLALSKIYKISFKDLFYAVVNDEKKL